MPYVCFDNMPGFLRSSHIWQNLDFDKFRPEPLKTRIARITCGSHTEGFLKSGHIYTGCIRNSIEGGQMAFLAYPREANLQTKSQCKPPIKPLNTSPSVTYGLGTWNSGFISGGAPLGNWLSLYACKLPTKPLNTSPSVTYGPGTWNSGFISGCAPPLGNWLSL